MNLATLPVNSGTSRHVIRKFDSWADYVQCAKACPNFGGSPRRRYGKLEWSGTPNYESAIALAENGWTEVRPEVDALIERIESRVTPSLQMAFTSYFDISGGGVDIGRFLDGEPECMVEIRLVEIAKPGRVIRILINGGYLSGVSVEDMTKRGAAIVGLVESLERLQHSTEIWLEITCAKEADSSNPALTHLICLKRANQALDIDMLMFAIAHPSRHRRMTFAVRENESNCEQYGIGRGSDGRYSSSIENMCENVVDATLCLEQLGRRDKITENADEWIIDNLREFGLIREGA